MADVREIKVRLGSTRWVKVDEGIFRSWTGSRRLNGEDYTGPVFILGSDVLADAPDVDEQLERSWYDESFICAHCPAEYYTEDSRDDHEGECEYKDQADWDDVKDPNREDPGVKG